LQTFSTALRLFEAVAKVDKSGGRMAILFNMEQIGLVGLFGLQQYALAMLT
jgi:hypothetical protein